MKKVVAVIMCGAVAALTGCNQGTSGGPGASSPPTKAPITGQTESTFSLTLPTAKLAQGQTVTVPVTIKRGQNFGQEVSLKLGELPKGVTLAPGGGVIKHGDTETNLSLTAVADAALGEFTVKVTGHPAKGADAVSEMKLTVSGVDPQAATAEAAEAATVKWNEYAVAMQAQWDQFSAKYAELKESAAKAEGQAKADLDVKLAAAKTKLDAAAVRLEELKSAGADRWEKVKEGVEAAFADMKKAFE